MNREEFDALVKQLETRAARGPGLFKWGTGAWAVLGFGYLLLVLVVSLALTLGLLALILLKPNALTLKLGIVVGIVTGGLCVAIVRGLFVRVQAPEGVRLQRAEVPELFALIEGLQRELRAPRFHRVLLIGAHNAAVVQVPRLGVFGWHCNYLLLGLPLMQGVAVEEFRAILAHEFAHLSGAHGKFGTWLYRLRRTWEQVFEQLARQKQGGGKVLGGFISWFWPRFNARAFVLSRAQEYEADALAARVVSARALATGLIRVQVQGRWLEERFWPEVYGRVREQAAPPASPFHELGGGLNQLHMVPDATRWLTQAYHFETNNADTHPCLKDRLRALPGLPVELPTDAPPESMPTPPEQSAASALLGAHGEALAAKFNAEWATAVTPGWKERHEAAQKLSSELAAVEAAGEETTDALWKRAEIILDRDGDEAAQPLLERMLAEVPDHAQANFVRGRHLLAQDDPRGPMFMERAMAKDPFATSLCCQLLHAFYERNGQREKLKDLLQRIDEHELVMHKAQVERADATVKDVLLPPDLTEEQRAHVVAVAQQFAEVAAVHVVRKQLTYFPDRPMFLLAVTVKVPWWKPRSSGANGKLVNAMVEKLELPGNFLVFVVEKNLKPLGRRVCGLSSSEVYRHAG